MDSGAMNARKALACRAGLPEPPALDWNPQQLSEDRPITDSCLVGSHALNAIPPECEGVSHPVSGDAPAEPSSATNPIPFEGQSAAD
jgi:hypothetical protein